MIQLQTICKIALVFSSFAFSFSAFAQRSKDTKKVCAAYKLEALALPASSVIFNYGETKITYIKDDTQDIYYQASDITHSPFYPTGFLTLKFKKDVKTYEYRSFTNECGLNVEDSYLKSFYVSTPQFNPVTAAKALENTEWFDEVYPDFSGAF